MTCYRLVVCHFHKKELSPPKNKICNPHGKRPRYVKVLRNNGKKFPTWVCMYAQLHLIFSILNLSLEGYNICKMASSILIFNFLWLTHIQWVWINNFIFHPFLREKKMLFELQLIGPKAWKIHVVYQITNNNVLIMTSGSFYLFPTYHLRLLHMPKGLINSCHGILLDWHIEVITEL